MSEWGLLDKQEPLCISFYPSHEQMVYPEIMTHIFDSRDLEQHECITLRCAMLCIATVGTQVSLRQNSHHTALACTLPMNKSYPKIMKQIIDHQLW